MGSRRTTRLGKAGKAGVWGSSTRAVTTKEQPGVQSQAGQGPPTQSCRMRQTQAEKGGKKKVTEKVLPASWPQRGAGTEQEPSTCLQSAGGRHEPMRLSGAAWSRPFLCGPHLPLEPAVAAWGRRAWQAAGVRWRAEGAQPAAGDRCLATSVIAGERAG